MSLTSTIKKTATKMATLTKGMMPSGSSTGMLNNKWILYTILFISIIDLFNFYSKSDTTAIAIFLVVGFLTTYFSKNMLVVLVVAIAVTHIARFGTASMEGMENEEDDEVLEEEVKEGLGPEVSEEKKNSELEAIQKTLEKMSNSDPSTQTQALIDQTQKVQENMALLEPYLKAAEQITEPFKKKEEGFCDYSSAYKA
jgi:hypothetical protein